VIRRRVESGTGMGSMPMDDQAQLGAGEDSVELTRRQPMVTGASAAQQPEAKSDSKTVGGSIQPRHPGARAGTRPRKLAGAGNMVTLEGYLDPHAEARGRVL
jgi:hypothetical protein